MSHKGSKPNRMPKGLSITRIPRRGPARAEWAKSVKALGLSPDKLISRNGALDAEDRAILRANAQSS